MRYEDIYKDNVEQELKDKQELKDLIAQFREGNKTVVDLKNCALIKNVENCDEYNLPATVHMNDRQKLRQEIIKKYMNDIKSAVKDEYGNIKYDGEIKRQKVAQIVIGFPASGKSTLTNSLSEQMKARIIDSDEVKKMLPEFKNGLGATAVHEESKDILRKIFKHSCETNENVVIPIVGGKKNKIEQYIKELDRYGYNINITLVDLKQDECIARTMTRFLETGRYIDPETVKNYNNPKDILEKIEEDINEQNYKYPYNIRTIKKYDNNVQKGKPPILKSYKYRMMGLIEVPRNCEFTERKQQIKNP